MSASDRMECYFVMVGSMNYKAIARYCYAAVPGVAAIRFGWMDLAAGYLVKPEFRGIKLLEPIGAGLIVDIGANRGQSISALRRFAPSSKVTAFEPDPRSFLRLSSQYRRDSATT